MWRGKCFCVINSQRCLTLIHTHLINDGLTYLDTFSFIVNDGLTHLDTFSFIVNDGLTYLDTFSFIVNIGVFHALTHPHLSSTMVILPQLYSTMACFIPWYFEDYWKSSNMFSLTKIVHTCPSTFSLCPLWI